MVPGIRGLDSFFIGLLTISHLHYLEGCNFITAAVSTPSNCMGHLVLLLWGSESKGFITRWFIMGGSWIFLGFMVYRRRRLLSLVVRNFSSCQHKDLQRNSVHGPFITYVSVFILYPLGQASWFFGPSFGVVNIFRFLLFLQGFHNWTLNPFHMIRVACIQEEHSLVSNPWGNRG